MAEKKERKGRRAYLNDFREDINGQFVYEGDRYTLAEGGMSHKELKTRLWLMTVILSVACIAGGCIPAACMLDCFYCILPYAAEVIATVSIVWAMVKFSGGGEELRGYIFEKSIDALPQRTFLAMLFAGIGAVGVILNIILKGFQDTAVLTLAYLAIKLLVMATAWTMHKTVLSLNWNMKEKE